MLFYEFVFLFGFLPAVLAVDRAVPRSARNPWLLVASLVFYGTQNLHFIPILLLSITVDFVAAQSIARSVRPLVRRMWLLVSIGANLGILVIFKYATLISTTLRSALGEFVPVFHAALPIGISFYTFQSMSYSIDVYRRRAEPARTFVDFATYVSLFPQLIAGPIVRFSQLRPDLVQSRRASERDVVMGFVFFSLGLFKKLVLADSFAALAQPIFARSDVGFVDGWASIVLYAGQIYFDFSGYSDMAVGLGALLGFSFPVNFDAPYQARSFSDFWRRWHITLSTWLRDYLYISLGGNRKGRIRTYLNLMVTMLLGGLWHGASWNFAAWGLLHGAFLALERAAGRWAFRPPLVVQRAIVFVGVCLAWVPFRLDTWAATQTWWGAMLGGAGLGAVEPQVAIGAAAVLLLVWLPKSWLRFSVTPTTLRLATTVALFLLALFVGYGRSTPSPFLYFRF